MKPSKEPSKATSPVFIGFAAVIALTAAGCAGGDVGDRSGMKSGSAEVAPPQAKLRYYGGPKSPMG